MNLPWQTAQTNALIAELVGMIEGLPAGVVNVITGGHVSGDVLVRSPDVPVLSFTGSTATGKAISEAASANLKRVGLELGGKTPLILFEDADLDHALPIVVSALIVFSGQFCMTGCISSLRRSCSVSLIRQAVRTWDNRRTPSAPCR